MRMNTWNEVLVIQTFLAGLARPEADVMSLAEVNVSGEGRTTDFLTKNVRLKAG